MCSPNEQNERHEFEFVVSGLNFADRWYDIGTFKTVEEARAEYNYYKEAFTEHAPAGWLGFALRKREITTTDIEQVSFGRKP